MTLEERGRRECRVQAAPMARLQQGKQAAVTTGKAGAAGIPCAMVLRLIARSPRSAGLDSLRRLGLVTRGLIPASGDQDHTPSPSVKGVVVGALKTRSTPSRPPHPASHVRDDREPPL